MPPDKEHHMTMKLPRFVACIVRLFTATIDQAPMSSMEKERLTYFAVFVFLGVIAMSIYGAYNLAIGDLLLTTIIFSSGSGLILGWLLMCHLPLGKWVYRVSAVVYGSLLLYIFFLGGDNGSKSLWLFTFPLITLFLMGKNEGLAWSVILLVVAFALILFPGLQPFRYGNEFLARLATVYLIITSVAYWYEHFHEHYRRGMEVESTRLKWGGETLSDPTCPQDEKGQTRDGAPYHH